MMDIRPIGFRDYVRSNGFHTVYLLKPVHGAPVKIGCAFRVMAGTDFTGSRAPVSRDRGH